MDLFFIFYQTFIKCSNRCWQKDPKRKKNKSWLNFVFLNTTKFRIWCRNLIQFSDLIFDLIEKREKIQEIINISVNFIPTEDLLIYLKSLWKSKSDGIFKSSNTEGKNFNYSNTCRPKCHFFYKINERVYSLFYWCQKNEISQQIGLSFKDRLLYIATRGLLILLPL